MNQKQIDLIALRILEAWIIALGFKLSNDWDENDPSCRWDYGPHRVYTVCGRTLENVDSVVLSAQLERYLQSINNALRTKFHAYDVELYANPFGFGTSVYVSLYI